jgi:probable phosphoglycerate mutase
MITKLYLVRHGESTWNAQARYQGQLDTPISELGQEQSRALARRLASEGLDVVYTSPLARSVGTARLIADALEIEVREEPRFIEIHHGEWQGMYVREVEEKFGDLLKLWKTHPSRAQMPGGESFDDVMQRALEATGEILDRHAGQRVAVVSHDIPLKAIIVDALKMDRDNSWALGFENGAFSVVEYGSRKRLTALNDIYHLDGIRSSLDKQAL